MPVGQNLRLMAESVRAIWGDSKPLPNSQRCLQSAVSCPKGFVAEP